jgi:hypothetical protein
MSAFNGGSFIFRQTVGAARLRLRHPGRHTRSSADFNQRGEVHLDMVEVMVLDEADRTRHGLNPQVRQIIRQTPMKGERQTAVLRHLHRRRDEPG